MPVFFFFFCKCSLRCKHYDRSLRTPCGMRQVQFCCHHHMFSGDLVLVCPKHSRCREISNKFGQQNAVQLVIFRDDNGKIFQPSLSEARGKRKDSSRRFIKKNYLSFILPITCHSTRNGNRLCSL